MEAILGLFPPVNTIAEIGADHGILSAHLLKRGLCKKMIITDRSAVSLDKARRLFLMHNLDQNADFRVGDGFFVLPKPADAVLIAGMGSESILSILENAKSEQRRVPLILQANGKQHLLRRWLFANQYIVEAEAIAKENRRFYIVIRAVPGEKNYTDKEAFLGPVLLQSKPAHWYDYLRWLSQCLAREKNPEPSALLWVQEEIEDGFGSVAL